MIVTITMITKSNCQKNQVLRIFVSIGCTIASSWCILVILGEYKTYVEDIPVCYY